MTAMRPVIRLTILAVFLSVGLFAFAVANRTYLAPPYGLGCGVVALPDNGPALSDRDSTSMKEHAGQRTF
jgi:hypothetical protein